METAAEIGASSTGRKLPPSPAGGEGAGAQQRGVVRAALGQVCRVPAGRGRRGEFHPPGVGVARGRLRHQARRHGVMKVRMRIALLTLSTGITFLQIAQMVGGVYVAVRTYISLGDPRCAVPVAETRMGLVIYVSYLLLFAQFGRCSSPSLLLSQLSAHP